MTNGPLDWVPAYKNVSDRGCGEKERFPKEWMDLGGPCLVIRSPCLIYSPCSKSEQFVSNKFISIGENPRNSSHCSRICVRFPF